MVVASRSGEKCEEFAKSLCSKGYKCVGMSLYPSNDESIENLATSVISCYKRIDILVNNAVDRSNMTPLSSATRQKLQYSASVNHFVV